MLYADSQAPGAKSDSGSLRLSHLWLPQPAAWAAAFCDDTGGDGGLAQDSRGTPRQSAGEQLPCCMPRPGAAAASCRQGATARGVQKRV